ncbi:MAG TPA: succinate dehydrogenase, hydrophobic membrane anchor protein [Trueperaceae bacterium]|nr:succinate dehydrogenase, hydrophobic membrane anchor protein [Trueperaceae bacterium]
MAVRPRNLQEARDRSRNNAELAWWVFMRISGLFLVFLVFAHVFINNIAINVATVDYSYVAGRLAKPSVKVFDTFLLGLAMLHGVNGLRVVIGDNVRRPGLRFWIQVVLIVVSVAIFVAGVMTLWAFSYREMGDAIRDLTSGH